MECMMMVATPMIPSLELLAMKQRHYTVNALNLFETAI